MYGDEVKFLRKKYDFGYFFVFVGKGILILVLVCCIYCIYFYCSGILF